MPQWLCALAMPVLPDGRRVFRFFKPFTDYREKTFFIVGPEKGWGVGEGSGGRAGKIT
jgi:hypothetical protein